jgi:hypothetical protein
MEVLPLWLPEAAWVLKQTAMESGQKYHFSCGGCTALKTYPMTYTFDISKDTGCQQTRFLLDSDRPNAFTSGNVGRG